MMFFEIISHHHDNIESTATNEHHLLITSILEDSYAYKDLNLRVNDYSSTMTKFLQFKIVKSRKSSVTNINKSNTTA